ncbi:hypothetical protein T10_480 [Trichinella papuae]|uniref:Uncharacterized protein n=1 Tax=Trichinella papuae TaxID=268474 RepID=A0A0V1MDC2_9BILA|nr:hypothetical protein T10_480 [Trichinella papuae]
MSESRLLKSEQSGISRLQLTIIPTSKLEQREIRICLCLLSLSEQPTLVCRYAVDLQVQCKAVSAYDVPHHNSGDNDLTKAGGKINATNAKLKKIKTLKCTERRRCEREIGLRQHRFCGSRRLIQTGQSRMVKHVWTCPDFRFHASTVQHSVRITQNLSKHDYKASAGCMNRSGKYSQKFDIHSSGGTHIP